MAKLERPCCGFAYDYVSFPESHRTPLNDVPPPAALLSQDHTSRASIVPLFETLLDLDAWVRSLPDQHDYPRDADGNRVRPAPDFADILFSSVYVNDGDGHAIAEAIVASEVGTNLYFYLRQRTGPIYWRTRLEFELIPARMGNKDKAKRCFVVAAYCGVYRGELPVTHTSHAIKNALGYV